MSTTINNPQNLGIQPHKGAIISIKNYKGYNTTNKIRVGTNSGIDYWNGTLNWTTGTNHFPFVNKFLC